jgi:iron complex outermembrane receptor protein
VQAVADAQGTLSLQPKQLSSANASEKTQAMKENTSPLSHEKDDDSVFELGEMIVTTPKENHSLTSKDIATSVDIMYADKIEDQNVLTAYDLYHRMPGVQITQYGQGTTTGKLSFRGFNGEGRVNAVKLLIDGIPSNTNDGNMPFIDAIFPLDIESIETVRGTNDPRYGLHAIAGSSSINTYTGGNYIKGRTSYGSFDTYDVQSGLGYEKNGFSQNYQISYRNSAGYRDHSESDKNSFSGKWFYTPQDHQYKVGLIARWSDADAEEAGYLTSQEKIISRTQSMPRNATDGGKRSVGQVSTHLDINLSETLFWSNKAYGNLFDDQRIVMFDPCCAQVSRNRDEVQYGAITALTYHPKTNWLDDFSIETGFDFQQQENKYKQFRTDLGVPRVPINATNIRNDDRWNFLNYGGYIQAVIKPTKWLKLTPGYRADIIEGDFFSDRPGTNRAFPLNDYGTISQPKIGATITPIEGYSLYGNWGRTFQVGLGQATFIGNANQRNIGPSLNDGWEVGIKAKPTKWLESRVAYWMQDASNEISRTLGSNDSTLIGPSKRQGVDIEVKVNPHRLVDVWSAFSLQEAKVTNPPPSVQYSMEYVAGNQIVNTPNYLFSAGLDYQVTPKLRSSLWTSGQGDFFADQSNTRGKYGEYAMLNLDLGYQITKEVELQFQAKNLNDAKREYLWFDETYGSGAQILYSPSDGRAFYGAVNVRFD